MKITAIRLEPRRLELDPPFPAAWDPQPRRGFEATLVHVETDEGLVGVGSGDTMAGFEAYEHLFLGHDPLELERHVRALETIAFHAARYWPLEAALWDLAGQAEGVPVARLLGGAADRLPVYASTGVALPAAERAERALALREEGFRALKLRIDRERVDEGLECVRAVREAVGETMEIAVDVNQGWAMPGDTRPPLAPEVLLRIASELREQRVLWLEEPLPTSDPFGLAELRAEGGVPLAGGEMTRTVPELEACLEADALDVYQPDGVLAVGILRARDFALSVLERGRSFTPHTWTNGIGLLANLHLAAGVGAGPYLEFPYDPPDWTAERRDFVLAEPLRPDAEGFLHVPEAPGLGVALA